MKVEKDNILTDKDINMYYTLRNHISKISPNIAIVGDYKKYKKYINKILKKYENLQDVLIIKHNSYTRIIYKDIEKNYIWISNLEQLYRQTFQKYI